MAKTLFTQTDGRQFAADWQDEGAKMTKAEKLLLKINTARASIGLKETSAGFNYPEAIRLIKKKRKCTDESIGERIGLTGRQVGKIREGNLPNHISGEFLCGLWKDTFKDYDLDNLPMAPRQTCGGTPDLPPRRKRLVE